MPQRLGVKFVSTYLQLYNFHKKEIPEDPDEKKEMVAELMKFNVSLVQYRSAMEMANVTM